MIVNKIQIPVMDNIIKVEKYKTSKLQAQKHSYHHILTMTQTRHWWSNY